MLGAKLAVLEEIIFTISLQRLQESEVPPTLMRLIMQGVYSRFNDIAVTEISAFISSDSENKEVIEKKGTLEELKQDLTEKGIEVIA